MATALEAQRVEMEGPEFFIARIIDAEGDQHWSDLIFSDSDLSTVASEAKESALFDGAPRGPDYTLQVFGPFVAGTPFVSAALTDDIDLAMAAEGETCEGCGRASIDCSRAPCDDVLEDRGELTRWTVELVAADIAVTADNEADATRYAAEDAGSFAQSWNYTLGSVNSADDDEELTERGQLDEIAVSSAWRRGDVWSFNATATLIVRASDEADAERRARLLLTGKD